MCGNRYKYLGTIYYDHLKFVVNTEAFVKRGQQRIHLLHKLNSLSVGPVIFCCFYKSFIESLLRCSFICCFHSLTVKETAWTVLLTSVQITQWNTGKSSRKQRVFRLLLVMFWQVNFLCCCCHQGVVMLYLLVELTAIPSRSSPTSWSNELPLVGLIKLYCMKQKGLRVWMALSAAMVYFDVHVQKRVKLLWHG